LLCGMPNTTGGILNTTGGILDTTGGIPKTTGGIPKTTGGIPNTTRGIFNTTGGILDTTGGIPKTTGGIPNTTRGIFNDGTPGMTTAATLALSTMTLSGTVGCGGICASFKQHFDCTKACQTYLIQSHINASCPRIDDCNVTISRRLSAGRWLAGTTASVQAETPPLSSEILVQANAHFHALTPAAAATLLTACLAGTPLANDIFNVSDLQSAVRFSLAAAPGSIPTVTTIVETEVADCGTAQSMATDPAVVMAYQNAMALDTSCDLSRVNVNLAAGNCTTTGKVTADYKMFALTPSQAQYFAKQVRTMTPAGFKSFLVLNLAGTSFANVAITVLSIQDPVVTGPTDPPTTTTTTRIPQGSQRQASAASSQAACALILPLLVGLPL